MPRTSRAALRLVDLSGDPPGEVLLFRAGVNKSYKGLLLFDEEAARRVLADFEAHGAELFFDYDHASLFGFSKGTGEAAAWFHPEVREGALWAVYPSCDPHHSAFAFGRASLWPRREVRHGYEDGQGRAPVAAHR